MNVSKQFISKSASTPPVVRSNVKVWGQKNQRPSLDRTNSGFGANKFKSFTPDKDKISKIFAPKLTVIDNSISLGNKPEVEVQNASNKVKATTVSPKEIQNISNPPDGIIGSAQVDESFLNEQNSHLQSGVQSQTDRGYFECRDSGSFERDNADKKSNFLSSILPKISFGKYTFGVQNKINNEQEVNSKISESQTETSKKYDPAIIFDKLNSHKKQESKLNFFHHIKSSSNAVASNWWDSIRFDFYDKEWFRRLNYQFVAFDIAKNLNRLIAGVCVLGIISFFAYLAFFDQYFTIKKYTVEYASGSYLNNQQTFDLITHFQKNKLYKVFPNNQYWFANNLSLTASAKEIFPEIKSVNIKNREWPDRALLQVETNKPTLTLWVTENNEQKYWRINENGKISSQDKAAIWYNLVKVEKPYTLQGDSTQQLSLFNHSFENDPSQKQRFKFTKKLLDYFKSIDIDITTTIFPSISDTDIIMESSGGTKFLFDSLVFDTDMQIERLDYFLKSKSDNNEFYDLQKKGTYAYFDFRVIHKAHICKISEKCNIKIEDPSDKK
jgi:hypothetical protein